MNLPPAPAPADPPGPSAPAGEAFGTVLVADDNTAERKILATLLIHNGYQVIEARDGKQAVEQFHAHTPDIVCLDVIMPELDGYQACRRIKAAGINRFVPVLFVTALDDDQALAKCIEAGGDDFISKPYSATVLRAKLSALERTRTLHRDITNLHHIHQREQEIAEQVFNTAVIAGNVALDSLLTRLKPAGTFSGDMLLSEYSPAGDLHLLLGDFTGHGLAAALGALPASEVFRAMTRKGFTSDQIIASINKKLSHMLPTGMFLAIQFVKISHDLSQATVINCGMPDALLLDGQTTRLKQTISSGNLPLGILPDFQPGQEDFHYLSFKQGDHLLLSSDGVYEAQNREGQTFGFQRVDEIINRDETRHPVIDAIAGELDLFRNGMPPQDDISLVEIPLTRDLLRHTPSHVHERVPKQQGEAGKLANSGWDLSLTLEGQRLNAANPVPLLISQIQELEGLENERQALFTVLTELYVNALDHGVLRLSSALKATPSSFAAYFAEREHRLATLTSGRVAIRLRVKPNASGGRMFIRVEDSGPGFDFSTYATAVESDIELSGRGIKLIRELSESLRYEQPGNKVEVVYRWLNDS